jgi:hypothetical protein
LTHYHFAGSGPATSLQAAVENDDDDDEEDGDDEGEDEGEEDDGDDEELDIRVRMGIIPSPRTNL